jgi:coiled-coil domain-containing protein 130
MPTLRELEEVKSEWKDDYKLNSMMRSKFRTEKKAINEQKTKDKEFLDKWNINVNLVKENDDDIKLASLYKYNKLSKYCVNNILSYKTSANVKKIFKIRKQKS